MPDTTLWTQEERHVFNRLMAATTTAHVLPVWGAHRNRRSTTPPQPPHHKHSLHATVVAFHEAIPESQHDWSSGGAMNHRRLLTIAWMRQQDVLPTPAQVTAYFCDLR